MKVQVIPATMQRAAPIQERKRVAAYARVSTLSSEQEESFESQVAYFTDLIERNADWELAQIYADRGKSGLNTEKRTEFNRMMRDGKKGKFQILLVKSISRFARNTLTTIQCIRELKSRGVEVRFQKEALTTESPQMEFLLTIMASMAQQESLSISANVQLGLTYKMQRGEWHAPFKRFLGYRKLSDGTIVIDEEQAAVVISIDMKKPLPPASQLRRNITGIIHTITQWLWPSKTDMLI